MRRRLRHARRAAARAGRSEGRGAVQGVPDALAHRRGAGRHRRVARQHRPRTTGTGTCSTPSRAPTTSATRTRSSSCAARRTRWSSSSSTSACRSTGSENGTIYQRPFGGQTQNYGERRWRALLRGGRPHRPCDAAHALPAQRARAHAVLRRVDGARPDPRPEEATCSASSRWRWRPARSSIFQAKATLFATGGAGASMPRAPMPSSIPATASAWRRAPGIPLEDMEFWQFHPTGVAGAGVLITEGVRGEGGSCSTRTASASWSATRRGQGPGEPRRGVARDGDRDQGRPRLPARTATTSCSSSITSGPK